MSQQPPQQYNYGQGFSNQPTPAYYPPPKKSNTGRNCLIAFLAFSGLVVVACIGLAVAGGFLVKQVIEEVVDEFGNTLIATTWTASLSTGEFDEIVCAGSDAETYSLQFVEDNPNIIFFDINTIEEDSNADKVYLSGVLSYRSDSATPTGVGTPTPTHTRDYTATFYFKDRQNDSSGLSTFGLKCIDRIEGSLQ